MQNQADDCRYELYSLFARVLRRPPIRINDQKTVLWHQLFHFNLLELGEIPQQHPPNLLTEVNSLHPADRDLAQLVTFLIEMKQREKLENDQKRLAESELRTLLEAKRKRDEENLLSSPDSLDARIAELQAQLGLQ